MFAKGYISNWYEENFVIKKVKSTVPQTYVISDINGEAIVGTFYVKELQKTNQKEFRVEKLTKTATNYMLNGKSTIALLVVRLIKKTLLCRNELFSTFWSLSKKQKPNLSNCETTTDLKISTDIDTIPQKLLKRMIQLI